ncbi:MAG: LacI family transcriptional regulator [Alphaproteobacteria bacterium]|nr:LacI family transcriptional regulator [Alphaproteobacteria bacterium]MBU1526590.1 LacI family transcriptional regulator [Alphaproteobacteria bacterium]MBU2118150.1 LacI family transcriptional regulator [Alphaproteobacteria bacterium]MBU2351559.1 LacI family transcriptional regulator [Alphaproteobacteria bacterium]MBU2383162.1 LacI family transcriptional regulator [Alphaproteobacteria bacterium]
MKPANIRDVAQRAEVSVASVSRVLNGAGPVTDVTRKKVMEAVEALQYVPHSGARSLSTSRSQTVGVILPDLYGEFFSELIRGIDLAARERGYHLIVSSSHDDAGEAAAAVRSMRGRVDGLILMSPHAAVGQAAAGVTGGLPVVRLNDGAAEADRPAIVVDNHGGAVAAVKHLIALGRSRIAHIAGPNDNMEAEARLSGYLEAMAEAGLDARVIEGDFDMASGRRAGLEMARSGDSVDAVFAGNDMMALGVMLALQDAGRLCPEDVAVVGFDDVPLASLVRPGLTTLRIDIAEIGRSALVRLLAAIDGQQDTGRQIVRPELVIRGSTSDPDAQRPTTDGRPSFATTTAQGDKQDV